MFNAERARLNIFPDLWHAMVDLKGISKDLLVLLALPAAVIAVTTAAMWLPAGIMDALKLNVHGPSIWQFITSSFVHVDIEHYWNNMSVFTLLIVLQAVLIAKVKEGKRLFLLLLATLLIVPPVAASFELLYVFLKVPLYSVTTYGCGSSAIVSAIFGFSPIVILAYGSKRTGKNLFTQTTFFLLAAYILFMFCAIYYPYHGETLLTGAAGAILVVCLAATLWSAYKSRSLIMDTFSVATRDYFKNIVYYSIIIILALLFLNAPFQLFPTNVVSGGSWVNFLSHFIGLVIGFSMGYNFFYRIQVTPAKAE